MNEMKKRERFEAAIAGGEVDHLPSAAWLHFANEHLSGEESADLQVRFMRFYGWDFCKVMNDYRYPFPTEVPALQSVDDMKRFEPMPMTERSYAEQLKCIRRLRAELGPEIPLMETLFDPMQQILRRVGYRRIEFICANPEHALPMLEAVTKTLEHYLLAAKEAGSDGLFYSVNGGICPPAKRGVDEETFRTFLRPFDLRILEAAEGMPRILHVHGPNNDFGRLHDYPCEAYSWSDRFADNPSLSEGRKLTDKTLLGGILESNTNERSLEELGAEVDDAVRQVGIRNFILAPGCAVNSDSPMDLLKHMRRKSESYTPANAS